MRSIPPFADRLIQAVGPGPFQANFPSKSPAEPPPEALFKDSHSAHWRPCFGRPTPHSHPPRPRDVRVSSTVMATRENGSKHTINLEPNGRIPDVDSRPFSDHVSAISRLAGGA